VGIFSSLDADERKVRKTGWNIILPYLLSNTNCQIRSLAAVGATITILALALDPFFQQVVNSRQKWVTLPLNGTSTIPLVLTYDPKVSQGNAFQGLLVLPNDEIQTVARKFFFENGTAPIPFGNGTRADIPLSCPTSNCTWPLYETLAVCSACKDVSSLLQYDCLNIPASWLPNANMSAASILPNITVCGYFMNATATSGTAPLFLTGYANDSASPNVTDALIMRTFPLVRNPTRSTYWGGSINFKYLTDPIVDFLIVGAPNGASGVFRNETPIAKECVLNWCTKTFRSSYYGGKYEETEESSYSNHTIATPPWSIIKESVGIDITYTHETTIKHNSLDEDNPNEYKLSNRTGLNTILVFDEILPSFVTAANESATPTIRSSIASPEAVGGSQTRPYPENYWIPANGRTQDFVKRLATAMTNVIRSNTNSNTMFAGEAHDLWVFVEARWEWLTLPVSLLVLSFVFLLATIIRSSREHDQVGVWKSSAIANILYGLPPEMREKIAAKSQTGTPREKAKELKVALLSNKHGWRISGHPFSPFPKSRNDPVHTGWI
jgi:hypothetical protein